MSAPDSAPVVHGDEQTPPTRPQTTWAEVEALAAILEPEAFDPDQSADEYWRTTTRNKALTHAARVLAAGYVRVQDDDETLTKLRAAMRNGLQAAGDFDVIGPVAYWNGAAHAVIAALRGSVSGGGNATEGNAS